MDDIWKGIAITAVWSAMAFIAWRGVNISNIIGWAVGATALIVLSS